MNIFDKVKVSILTQYKALFIRKKKKIHGTGQISFNPYSIQGIVHQIKGEIVRRSHCGVSILTQYKALFIIWQRAKLSK